MSSATAHPGHGPAIVTIDRPAAGTLYQNDVQQPGQIQQVGSLQNPAASIGSQLTIAVSWACPPQSTTAVVGRSITDANGNEVYNGGSLFAAPSGTSSVTWSHGQSGTFTIHATVQCMHTEYDRETGVLKTIPDGADMDQRTVIVIAE
jgi:hypothetical protein